MALLLIIWSLKVKAENFFTGQKLPSYVKLLFYVKLLSFVKLLSPLSYLLYIQAQCTGNLLDPLSDTPLTLRGHLILIPF